MEAVPEAATARPAGGGPQGTQIGSRTASSMEMTSAVERSGREPQLHNGHLPRPWSCSLEDRTPSLMAPQHGRAWGMQLQGPSVLESKVRALKEKMSAGKQGVSPCLTSHERPSKKPKCRRVKVGTPAILSERSSLPGAEEVLPTQNLPVGQLDSGINKEEPAQNGGSRPPRPPSPGLECWKGRSPWPPEAVQALPDNERSLPPGPGSLQESPVHRVTPGRPGGPGPCNKVAHMSNLRKGRSYALQDGLGTGGDLDSLSVTCEEDFVPRPALLGGLWRAAELGALGTGASALSLSDQVERNRLLLQEMLNVGGQGPPRVGIPAWTPSWDRRPPERPAGDVDWDSGISLQDSDQSRTFRPKPESVLSPRHEEAKHLLQRARMKARTRPLRASHEIVPAVAQGGREGRRSPAPDARMPSACRDTPQNGNTSDSSSGESSSGQWPKRGASPSRVRFEDESARDAESRYLERQRQRPARGGAGQTAAQGPLRSKPELAHYVRGGFARTDAGGGALCRLVGRLEQRGFPAPPPERGSDRKCQACGSCLDDPRPGAEPRALQEREGAGGGPGVRAEPLSARGPSPPSRPLPAEPRGHTEWIRETHIGDAARPEEADSALDSTDTSDSCRTDSEEAGTSQPSRARGPARGNSPRPRGSRPRGGPRWFRKAGSELPGSPQAPHYLPGVEHMEGVAEVKEGRGHLPEGTRFPREDAFAKPPALESKKASLGSQRPPGPGPGNHWVHAVDSRALSRTAYPLASSTKLGSSVPGRQAQDGESHESLQTVSASSLQQSHAERSALHQAQKATSSLSTQGWVPTPPSSRKTTSPVSHRKAALARPRRLGEQAEPVDPPLPPSRSGVPRTCELSPAQTQPCGPPVRHPLLALSTNNCNNSTTLGLQEPPGGAGLEGKVEEGPCSQEPPPENGSSHGGMQGFPDPTAAGMVSSVSITLSLASEEPESSREPEGGLQRPEMSPGRQVSSRASPGVSAGPGPRSAAPSDGNKKSSSSLASTLGLKKFFLALGHGARPKLGKARSHSVEQLQPPAPGPAPHTSTPRVKKAPSLQSLHLVSPSHQHRKAASFQNLHSLLSGKGDRSSLYVVGEPGDHSAAGRAAKASPRRALSVEDVSTPSQARTVGRVVEVFPDGTTQLQLQRSPEGSFGFCVASGDGRRDAGMAPPLLWAPHPWGLSKPLLAVGISRMWLRRGAPDSDSLITKGLEFSLQGLFGKSQVRGCCGG
ncbi:KIAA1614-like protein [Gulo gulo luscus]|nr:KIAA1614-like protein [Gulo gulo luscus]KAI5762976.1 KIAA1614-like protein [Gulo gulo luscus]WGG27297.1 KIAA1614 [Gulo gulo luscus]